MVENVGISKRVSGLFAVGALPASILSVVGDFLGPAGGWLVVGVVGVLAIFAAVYLIAYLSLLDGERLPFWYRLTAGDRALSWIWAGKTPFHSHGVHVVLIFGIVCMFSSARTYAAIERGGVLAGSIDQVKVTQEFMGISRQILKNQEEANSNLRQIKEGVLESKRETSGDPRKELANLGVAWSDQGLLESVQRGDLRVIELFVIGKYSVISDVYMWRAVDAALVSGNMKLQDAVVKLSRPIDSSVCRAQLLSGSGGYLHRNLPSSKKQADWIQGLCSDDVRVAVKEDLAERKEIYAKKERIYYEWQSLSDAKKKEIYEECLKGHAGVNLMFNPDGCERGIPSKPSLDILAGRDTILAWFD